MKFRDLRADEIECRIGTIKSKGLTLLLYKDARCDMNILDETVGEENWQRDHKECKGNLYCGVSIWNDEKKQWITKWDCGTESYTEKEKGEASDSFKRACVNWGIGRELYTKIFIWIPSAKCTIEPTGKTDNYNNPTYKCSDRFEVTHIKIENKKITELKLLNATTGVECFTWKQTNEKIEPIKDRKLTEKEAESFMVLLRAKKISEEKIFKSFRENYGVESANDLMLSQYAEIMRKLNNKE